MGDFLLQQTLDGISPGIVSGMAASKGDAPLKNEPAFGIIEKSLARGDRLKTASFFTCVIDIYLHSRNGGCSMPKVCFHPVFAHSLRLDKPYLRTELSLTVCHELFQFSEGRTGARAAWMQKHHELGLT